MPGRPADAEALEPFHRQLAAETSAIGGVAVRLVSNEAMMEQLAVALAAGVPPDAARLKEYRLADLGARGALLPLDRLVSGDARVRLGDFTPQSVEGSRGPAGGPAGAPHPLLGLPDSHQLVVLYWNKDLVARSGLDPHQPPGTWEALRRAARAVATTTPQPGTGAPAGSDPGVAGAAIGASAGVLRCLYPSGPGAIQAGAEVRRPAARGEEEVQEGTRAYVAPQPGR